MKAGNQTKTDIQGIITRIDLLTFITSADDILASAESSPTSSINGER